MPRVAKSPAYLARLAKGWPSIQKEYFNRQHKVWRDKNCAKLRARGFAYRAELKAAAFAAYGGRCVCCSEDHQELLTIDHIGGTGAKYSERRKTGRTTTGAPLYQYLRSHGYPEGFRVLCFNCNWAEGHYASGCPHKRDVILRLVKELA